jgi:hypothetical protein
MQFSGSTDPWNFTTDIFVLFGNYSDVDVFIFIFLVNDNSLPPIIIPTTVNLEGKDCNTNYPLFLFDLKSSLNKIYAT